MEGPLVTLAEDVRCEFLCRPVIIREKITFASARIARKNVGNALDVGARQIPWEIVTWSTDAKLALG